MLVDSLVIVFFLLGVLYWIVLVDYINKLV